MAEKQMTVPELKEVANRYGIEGADGMKKAELIEAIKKVEDQRNAEQAKPADPEKEKSLLGKIGDAVDHLLHPDKEKGEQDQPVSKEPEVKTSSSMHSDLEKHPKFAKFKKGSK